MCREAPSKTLLCRGMDDRIDRGAGNVDDGRSPVYREHNSGPIRRIVAREIAAEAANLL
jgi:hypothetical protein